ncbi:MAG: hypothetical protein LBE31_02100 [Deltaproteobacteria bacterium]|jgi:hypothetical protein|nr:hypothetical protein [Deltaproteobacteria bacterium]
MDSPPDKFDKFDKSDKSDNFDDYDVVPPSADEDPDARNWLYVLTKAVTKHRDQMLVLETGETEFIPAFPSRKQAKDFVEVLVSPGEQSFEVQAMHLFDLKKLAFEMRLTFLTLDAKGIILDYWNPQETAPNSESQP